MAKKTKRMSEEKVEYYRKAEREVGGLLRSAYGIVCRLERDLAEETAEVPGGKQMALAWLEMVGKVVARALNSGTAAVGAEPKKGKR